MDPDPATNHVTELLAAWTGGDHTALDRLLPIVRKQLRDLAALFLRHERPGHTLQPTALVHEAYIRLVQQDHLEWKNRAHFLGVAAYLMRQVLVDHARRHGAKKRGSGHVILSLDDELIYADEKSEDVEALDHALTRLAHIDERKSKVVELRFFGGLTTEETAEFLGVSPNTVLRDWSFARAWLRKELEQPTRTENVPES